MNKSENKRESYLYVSTPRRYGIPYPVDIGGILSLDYNSVNMKPRILRTTGESRQCKKYYMNELSWVM